MTTSSDRPLIILDMGGVVVVRLHDALSSVAPHLSRRRVSQIYDHHRKGLLSGSDILDEFWSDFDLAGRPSTQEANSRLVRDLHPLVSAQWLRDLSERADVVGLTNHRSEWIVPALEAAGLREHLLALYVSDQIGAIKPDPAAFASVKVDPAQSTCYVDDKVANLLVAQRHFDTVLTPAVDWRHRVDRWADQRIDQ